VKRRYTRKLWVDPRYQVVQMAAVVLANILVALLIAGLLSWFYLLVWDGSVAVNHNQRIPIYVAVAALAVTLVTVYCSLRRSRAIAGMMKKLHTVLSEAGEGQLPANKLAFRRDDYFPHLAEPLNLCLERLRHQDLRREEVRHLLAEIDVGSLDLDQVRQRLHALCNDSPTPPEQGPTIP
jgi:hypothetical protein